jgi:hypothetical protein
MATGKELADERQRRVYVDRYHVALPAEFLAHLASARWSAPAEVDMSSVELG